MRRNWVFAFQRYGFQRSMYRREVVFLTATSGLVSRPLELIFVTSIDPSFQTRGHEYLISTSVTIQDANGLGIEGARARIETTFPDGQVFTSPVKTDQTGTGTLTLSTTSTGLYEFKVRKVTHPTREYDASLNVETSDTLLIP